MYERCHQQFNFQVYTERKVIFILPPKKKCVQERLENLKFSDNCTTVYYISYWRQQTPRKKKKQIKICLLSVANPDRRSTILNLSSNFLFNQICFYKLFFINSNQLNVIIQIFLSCKRTNILLKIQICEGKVMFFFIIGSTKLFITIVLRMSEAFFDSFSDEK